MTMYTKENKLSIITTDDINEAKANVVPWQPQVVTGGKGPVGSDWLSPLPDGTVFLCRPSKREMQALDLYQFQITMRWNKAILLADTLQPNAIKFIPVDPAFFCRRMELFEVIGQVVDGELEENNE